MSFTVRLATDLLIADAGANTPLDIEITNRGDEQDKFELEIEGLDMEWTAVPVPIFTIPGHDAQNEKVFFKPPRVSESLTGNYPFVVKVRSLESGETRTAQGILQIDSYHHMSMEVLPKKGSYSPVRKQNSFHVTIINLGNVEETMKLFGSDPEDACIYEFSQDQVTVGPGQQKEIEVKAIPTNRRTFSSPRLHGFTLSARGVENPSVVCSAQAQLEQRPVLSPGAFAMTLIFLLVVAGWYALLPKPPSMDSLQTDKHRYVDGDTITVTWKASNAKSVKLTFNGEVLSGTFGLTGSYPIQATVGGGTLEATALRDGVESAKLVTKVVVDQKPTVPAPKVTEFEVKSRNVAMNEPFTVTYKIEGATSATLLPTGQVLDPNVTTVQVPGFGAKGTQKIQIVATNSAGVKAMSDEIVIHVNQVSAAKVVVFRASPSPVPLSLSKTTITWQLSNADRAELVDPDGKTTELPGVKGDLEISVPRSGEYRLIGYDSAGITVSKKISIVLHDDTAPPENPSTTGAATTGAATGGGHP